ncbi:MDR family MFS transporter [Effusibacillus dendaii]|uniref:MFS transporter n=1 Tax=Effusibacillus dendaii TaxID=2743772 RepID=A0A7I8DDV7_9BACL|nr:MFS transporter [Effusibacillus dendaii]BCJ86700.1 MFS transporter [Effusibacillus dendaii]
MQIASLSFGRPLWVLLSGILFTHLGYYLILPLLTIILTNQKGISVSQVGLILGTGSVTYLIGSLLGGWLNDRIGQRRTLVLGLLLRAIGLLGYGFVSTLPLLFIVSTITGIGGGIYTPPAKSGIALYASGENKTTAFSFRGIAANIGVTAGPLLGAWLVSGSTLSLFIAASVIYFGMALSHQFLLPADIARADANQSAGFSIEILQDRPFLLFSLVTIVTWALYAQFTFSIPLRAAEIMPSPQKVALLWSITSVLIIFLQAPITRYTSRVWHPLTVLANGMLLMGIGLGSVMWSSQFFHLLISVTIFTFGEMLIMPTVDTVVSELAKPEAIGTYFGIASFVWGAGEALGNMGGGQIMTLSKNWNAPYLPWIVYAAVCVGTALAYYVLRSWPALAEPLSEAVKERTHPTRSPSVSWRKKEKLKRNE